MENSVLMGHLLWKFWSSDHLTYYVVATPVQFVSFFYLASYSGCTTNAYAFFVVVWSDKSHATFYIESTRPAISAEHQEVTYISDRSANSTEASFYPFYNNYQLRGTNFQGKKFCYKIADIFD